MHVTSDQAYVTKARGIDFLKILWCWGQGKLRKHSSLPRCKICPTHLFRPQDVLYLSTVCALSCFVYAFPFSVSPTSEQCLTVCGGRLEPKSGNLVFILCTITFLVRILFTVCIQARVDLTKIKIWALLKSISGRMSYECESSVSDSSPLSLKLESPFSALKYRKNEQFHRFMHAHELDTYFCTWDRRK